MKQILIVFMFASFAVAGCNSYGDKVKVNDKSEVYYKEGASKEEAQKLGDYLLKNNYFDAKTEKSIQLTKTKDTFNVKFVVDRAMAEKEIPAIESTFTALGMLLSLQVFNGKPTKIMLADAYMKTFREIPVQTLGSQMSDSTAPVKTTDSSMISK